MVEVSAGNQVIRVTLAVQVTLVMQVGVQAILALQVGVKVDHQVGALVLLLAGVQALQVGARAILDLLDPLDGAQAMVVEIMDLEIMVVGMVDQLDQAGGKIFTLIS